MKWPPVPRHRDITRCHPDKLGTELYGAPGKSSVAFNWPPWAHRTPRVVPETTFSAPGLCLRNLLPRLRHRVRRPLLSPQAASAQGARNSGSPSGHEMDKDNSSVAELFPSLTRQLQSLLLAHTKPQSPPQPRVLCGHMQSTGRDTELDRHTDKMCLPSTAIVERKVRKD